MNAEMIMAIGWLALIAFFLLFYAVTDGADLGAGMLSLFFSKDEEERSLIMEMMSSTWHSNQTWLVIVGGMIFGAFPLFYAIVLSALYIPFMLMLFGLIIRGIGLDYHEEGKTKGEKRRWALMCGVGSIITSLAQGFAFGGLLGGIYVHEGHFAGGIWDWLNPFTGLLTVGLLFGYVTLGASLLVLKTTGDLQEKGYRYGFVSAIITGALSVGVVIWLFMMHDWMAHRLFTSFYIAPILGLAGLAAVMYLYSLKKRYETPVMFWNGFMVIAAFGGVSLALFPHMIPNVVSTPVGIADAAASKATLTVMTIVMAVLTPIILLYNAYEFWVFRGKVKEMQGSEEKEEEREKGAAEVETARLQLRTLLDFLSRQGRHLARLKLAYLRIELRPNIRRYKAAAVLLVLGGAVASAGYLAVLAAGVIALRKVIPLSASAALVGFLLIAPGYLIYRLGVWWLKRTSSDLVRSFP